MMIIKINNGIALSTADAIVNASNGIGFMGGKSGLECRKKGVAESLHFISQGAIEPLAKTKCKKHACAKPELPKNTLRSNNAFSRK